MAFNRLLADPDPALTATLVRNNANGGHGDVEKWWAEAAFEWYRRENTPNLVSRLDALYACFDPLDAYSLVDDGVAVGSVWKGVISEGTPWCATDYDAFDVVRLAGGADEGAFADAWQELQRRASKYWHPTLSTGNLEALVGGTINLVNERLSLRALLA